MEAPVIVLLSGGMDSVTALHDAHARGSVAAALSFDYGAKHNEKELACARWQAKALGVPQEVIHLPFVGEQFSSHLLRGGGEIPKGHYEEETMKDTVVPFRNGILLAIAAGFAESRAAEGVVIAAHSGDHAIYPDCREEFMQAMAAAIRLGTYTNVRLLRPFIDLSKGEIAQRGHALGVDFSRTWSCYVGAEIHCGECGTCVERREAFMLSGLPDPTEYASLAALPASPNRTAAAAAANQ